MEKPFAVYLLGRQSVRTAGRLSHNSAFHAFFDLARAAPRRGFRHGKCRLGGRGCSSVGRAVALQAIGQEFESPQLHHLARNLDL